MQHGEKLETHPFMVPLLINKNSSREQLLQSNHEDGSKHKDFNNNIDTSSSDPPKATIALHKPKVNSVRFEDP